MIYTDPRFWGWLYNMEPKLDKIFQSFTITFGTTYLSKLERTYYESCDLMLNISTQTHNIVQMYVRINQEQIGIQHTYHGINEKYFYPVENEKEKLEMNKMKSELFQGKDIDFCLFYNNRNIRRKMTSDTIMAFKTFADKLPKEKRDKTAFVLHTQPSDNNGTDLPAVVQEMCPDLNIIFSTQKLENKHLNYLYNIADVTINLASKRELD